MLKLATDFYDLEDEQIDTYANVAHKPDESAVKHLLQTYEDEHNYTIY
jgi:hypothetical protein